MESIAKLAKVIKLVTVYFENDNISCECICAIQDIEEGDLVQVFMNNAPAVGEIKAIKEIPLNEMTDAMYEMKSVIKKIPNPSKQVKEIPNTIKIDDIVNRSKAVTLIGFGVVGKLSFSVAEMEAHGAEVGDVLYFLDVDGSKFRTTILAIEDSNDCEEPRIHVSAVRKEPQIREFIQKNKIVFDLNSGDKKITLSGFNINEEEYVIGDWISNIGPRAFERCRKLKKLTLLTEGLSVDALAFAYNESIEEIIIHDYNSKIKVNSFDGCRNLRKVILPYDLYYMRNELLEYYGDKISFEYELFDEILLDGIVYSKNMEMLICCIDEEIEEYKAPLSVRDIMHYAFKNCSNLRLFEGSPFMGSPSVGIFAGCVNLENVSYRFENNYDVIFLFGEDYVPDSRAETVEYRDGTKRVFYLPKNCRFQNLPKPEEILNGVNPKDINPKVCAFIADYYSKIHKTKEAIKFHYYASLQGIDKSYQKLAEYVQIESIGQDYFTLDQFDYADRTQDIRPFFLMLSRDYPEYELGECTNSQILEKFSNREALVRLLETISTASIFDTDLLNVALNKLYRATEDIHDLEIKRLFLRCANKIGKFDNVLYFKEELLEEIFVTENDYREFGFDVVDVTTFIPNEDTKNFIDRMPESETKKSMEKAYNASQNPGPLCVDLFEEFILKAKETGDIFYQKCAILSIYAYVSLCWREKTYVSQFKTILSRILDLYKEGLDLLGFIVLCFKQNLKKSISKNFYMECAEKIYDAGILYDNTFNNLLGGYVQNRAAFFCKYPEYFDINDRTKLVMKEINRTWFYIYATTVMKPANAKTNPILYQNFCPELIDDELVLFLNQHEAVTYLKKKGIKLHGDFYRIPMGQVLSIMYTRNLDTVRVLPRTLNQLLTREYIDHTYDRRE